MAQYVSKPGEGAALEDAQKVERPRRFKVLLLNDDYTSMEFVVHILESVFRKARDEAVRVMLNVHQNGMGVAGVYVKSIAETKVGSVDKLARENGFPLKCSMEPE